MLFILAAVLTIRQNIEAARVAERIQFAQACVMLEQRAQHREIEHVQQVSLLEPELAAAEHQRSLARLVVR
jgi:hypothetical protein